MDSEVLTLTKENQLLRETISKAIYYMDILHMIGGSNEIMYELEDEVRLIAKSKEIVKYKL